MMLSVNNDLFGGSRCWNTDDWTDSDDRVRGGGSQSYLEIKDGHAKFYGHLDIETLGGAGFASQRTTGEERRWDLSSSDGIELTVDTSTSDDKKYTFILKDELLPKNPTDGREQSTTSWEYDFRPSDMTRVSHDSNMASIYIPWSQFRPTYRGRERESAEPLKTAEVKRMSIMMRSFFATQQGDFALNLLKISAVSEESARFPMPPAFCNADNSDSDSADRMKRPETSSASGSVWSRFFNICGRL